MTKPVFLKHELNQNNIEEIKHTVLELRPEWKNKDLIFENLTGGYINSMFCAHLSTDQEKENALVVRIFAEEEHVDCGHEIEIQNLQIAHQLGISPGIVAFVVNGVIYKFVPGRNLVFEDFFKSDFIGKQMELLAKLHSANPGEMQLYDNNGQPRSFQKTYHIENLNKMIDSVPEEIPDLKDIPSLQGFVGRKALADEWKKIVAQLETRNMSLTPSHNDFHMNNLIYNNGNLILIDYPSMSITYEAFDLGYIFSGFDFFSALGRIKDGQEDFGEDLRLLYCRSYLQHKVALSGRGPSCVTEENVKSLQADCDATQAMAAFSSLIAVMSKHGTGAIKFDTRRICQTAAECYIRKKDFLFRK